MTRPETHNPDDDKVYVAFNSPLGQRPATAVLPRELTVAQALDVLPTLAATDPGARFALQQLARETSGGAFDFLVVSASGEINKVSPSTPLHDLAVSREVRTATGMKKIPVVAVEVQAYAAVGWS